MNAKQAYQAYMLARQMFALTHGEADRLKMLDALDTYHAILDADHTVDIAAR